MNESVRSVFQYRKKKNRNRAAFGASNFFLNLFAFLKMKFFLPKRKRMVRTSRSLPNVSSITLREIGARAVSSYYSNFFPPRALKWDQPVPGVSLFRWTEDVFALVWLLNNGVL